MQISACVIVKNEEKNLPLWLDSMKRIADEMVVVDTGSSDRTVQLAEEAGARVSYFPWVNDFSAAKNFAIGEAKGDWILFLDADEYFPASDCQQVKAAIQKYDSNPKIVGLFFHRVEIEQETGEKLGMDCYPLRCFRNVEWLRYEGRVHESLENQSPSKGMGIMQLVQGVTIYHTGYSRERIHNKLERNLAILEEAQRTGHARDVDDIYLADCYYGMKEYEKAAKHAGRAVWNRVKAIGSENRSYTIWIQSMMLAKYPAEKIYAAIAKAVRRYPALAEYYMLWAMVDWDCQDFDMAEQHFRKSLELYRGEHQVLQKKLLMSHSDNYLPEVYFRLGEIAAWKNHGQEAAECFVESLKLRPHSQDAVRKLCQCLAGASPGDIISLLDHLYDRQKDGAFLADVFAALGRGELALFYEQSSGRHLFDHFEHCFFEGKLSDAAAALMESMEQHNLTER